jgi:hypothetical protein
LAADCTVSSHAARRENRKVSEVDLLPAARWHKIPAPQVSPHAPPEQTWPASQAFPHAPQLALSVSRLTHRPPHTTAAPVQSGFSFPQPASVSNAATASVEMRLFMGPLLAHGARTHVREP